MIAFWAYLKVLGKIGPEKSVYIVVFVPIIAMILSTIFENYEWQKSALLGMPLLVLGNLIGVNRINVAKILTRWR